MDKQKVQEEQRDLCSPPLGIRETHDELIIRFRFAKGDVCIGSISRDRWKDIEDARRAVEEINGAYEEWLFQRQESERQAVEPEAKSMDPESRRAQVLEGLKVKINELLFQSLPGSCTLDEMDEISQDFYYKVFEKWEEKAGDSEGA